MKKYYQKPLVEQTSCFMIGSLCGGVSPGGNNATSQEEQSGEQGSGINAPGRKVF